MAKLIRQGVYFMEGRLVKDAQAFMTSDKREKAIKNTVTYTVLSSRASLAGEELELKADLAAASGCEAVELMQTFFALGAGKPALPLTLAGVRGENCGALRAEENAYLLASAQRVGADFVPAHLADLDGYLGDCAVKSGQVVLGYKNAGAGAFGAMAIDAGDGLARVLAGNKYTIAPLETVAVYVKGKLRKGVGATDAALDILQAIGNSGFAEGKILEFYGSGVANLSMEARAELDGLMTLTGCLTTVWETDEKTEEFFAERGRSKAYKHLVPKQPAYYDWGITVDLTRVEPMIALPDTRRILPLAEYLAQKGEGVQRIAERAFIGGGYETLAEAAEIVRSSEGVPAFTLSVSPVSQQVYKNLAENGALSVLLGAGAEACASVVEAGRSRGLALASADAEEWGGSCACMDARSIAATAKNGGKLTSALDLEYNKRWKKCKYDPALYAGVYHGKKANEGAELPVSASVSALPQLPKLAKSLLAKALLCTKDLLADEDICTREIFRAHRSAPDVLARHIDFAEKDARCAERSAAVANEISGKLSDAVKKDLGEFVPPKGCAYGGALIAGGLSLTRATAARTALALRLFGCSVLVCKKETDACVRAALVGAGILPLTVEKIEWKAGDTFYFEGVADAVKRGDGRVVVKVFSRGKTRDAVASFGALTAEERNILLAGGRVNYDKASE